MKSKSSLTAAFLAGSGSLLVCSELASAFAPNALTFVGKIKAATRHGEKPCAAGTAACPKERDCTCSSCVRSRSMRLFADTVEEAAETEAPEEEEAAEEGRPRRQYTSTPKGKKLTEFSVGEKVQAKVKSIASYGAFCSFGSEVDGLLHVSRMSSEFVEDVNDVLKVGQELEVEIINIDTEKRQVGLSLNSGASAESSSGGGDRQNSRRGGSAKNAVLSQIVEAGWDNTAFVEGEVVNIMSFGCFVRVNDAGVLVEGLSGEFDGMVHISNLAEGHVDDVKNEVEVGQKVQIRVASIDNGKVSMTMLPPRPPRASFGDDDDDLMDDEDEFDGDDFVAYDDAEDDDESDDKDMDYLYSGDRYADWQKTLAAKLEHSSEWSNTPFISM